MDYEKAYKDALERARKIHDEIVNNEVIGFPEQITDIFPELAESEDERIRKEIISLVLKVMGQEKDNLSDNKYDAMLSWLEKQKEYPTNEEMLRTLRVEYEKGVADTIAKYGQKEQMPVDEQFPPLEGLDAIKAKYYDEGFKNGFDEGVDSVKPVEWSKEDEMWLQTVIGEMEVSKKEAREYEHKTYDTIILWLKSLRPQWKPSEKDIKMLEHIIGQYETGNKNSKAIGYLPRVEELNFLKKVLTKWKNSIN